jgi:ATP-dependent Zn protease
MSKYLKILFLTSIFICFALCTCFATELAPNNTDTFTEPMQQSEINNSINENNIDELSTSNENTISDSNTASQSSADSVTNTNSSTNSNTKGSSKVTAVNTLSGLPEANLGLNNILSILLIAIGFLLILFAIAILIRLKK